MTVKAVFLDWYNTLARHDPPTEALHEAACRAYGIEVDRQMLLTGIAEADHFFYDENVRSRVDRRLPNEQVEFYTRYQDIVLKRAGVAVPQGMALPIWMKVRDLSRGSVFVLFPDVLPALEQLRKRSLFIGLISNLTQDMKPLLAQLGLMDLIDAVVGPKEAGAEKPDPRIFSYALERANVVAPEAVHVGDQVHIDVAGALNSGMQAVLLDRFDVHADVDCLRIRTLLELPAIV